MPKKKEENLAEESEKIKDLPKETSVKKDADSKTDAKISKTSSIISLIIFILR